MAKNRLYERGDQLSVPVIAGVKSGDPVAIGVLPGVALTDRDAAGNATVQFGGVFKLSVTGAIAAVGDRVFINPGTGALTTAAGVGVSVYGVALATKAAGAGIIPVRVGYPAGATSAVG